MRRTCGRWLIIILIILIPGKSLSADEKALVIPTKRLTLDAALSIAKAAIEACRKAGVQVAVTVVDRGSHPQVVLRDVYAPDMTLQISRGKANTAVNFVAPTSSLKGNRGLEILPQTYFLGGGLPITAGGTLLGAIGVSGAPSSELDEKCAQAGIDSILEELEMID